MDQYELIRTGHRVYGKSISELARLTGHSRNTIKKAIRGEPWGYREREHQPFPVLEGFLEIIDRWLESDRDEPLKQRHTARRIYHRLIEEHGYKGSESTVRRYVRLARMALGLSACQAFIPCDPEAGVEAEVDWGSAMVRIRGVPERVKFFCMRSKFSGKHFVRVYPCERQQAFFDAHERGFGFFGGVFPVVIYDNVTTAVRRVFRGKDREEQEAFAKFRAYYSFEARFCNPGEAHEKGGVEGLVGLARRNYMVPVPDVESLEALNEKILKRCLAYGSHKMAGRDRTVNALYEEEKRHLVPLPPEGFSNVKGCEGRADKYATVVVDKNRYSVPSAYAGSKVKVLLFVDRVEIFSNGKRIARHERLYGNNKWCLHADHYLELLEERPRAFHSARPIRQWRESWPQCLHALLERFCQAQGETKGIRDFVRVLLMYREHSAAEMEAAVERAGANRISSSEGVRHLLALKENTGPNIAPLAAWSSLPPADVAVYGQLGGVS